MKLTSFILGAVGLAASTQPTFAQRGTDGHVNIIYWQAPSILNPYLSAGTKDVESSSLVIEPLGRFDQNGALVPFLAAEIPTVENGGVAADLTSITWKLKDGLKWSDGSPVTSADVKFTAEYCMHPEGGCAQLARFEGVKNVETIDDLTVKVNFAEPKPNPYLPFMGGAIADHSEGPVRKLHGCQGARMHRPELWPHWHRPLRGGRISHQ